MKNQELENLVKSLSLKFFGKEFRHQAVFNSRLRTTGGRYHLDTHYLDFNPKVVDCFSRETLEGIIKHELCHYHLHLENKGYRHRDQDFKRLLKEVGGLSYTPSFELHVGKMSRWLYHCKNCQNKLYRKRRFNTRNYVCGKCAGSFILKGKKEIKLHER